MASPEIDSLNNFAEIEPMTLEEVEGKELVHQDELQQAQPAINDQTVLENAATLLNPQGYVVGLEVFARSPRQATLKPENIEIVETARKKGKLRELVPNQRVFISKRHPRKGDPMTLEEIGDDKGITKEAVRRVEERTIESLKKANGNKSIDKDEVVRLFNNGEITESEVANLIGCGIPTVHRILTEKNAETKGHRRVIIDPNELGYLFYQGCKVEVLADFFQCSVDTVRLHIRANNFVRQEARKK